MIPFANSYLWGEYEGRGRSQDETFLKDFKRKCKLSGPQLFPIYSQCQVPVPITTALRQK